MEELSTITSYLKEDLRGLSEDKDKEQLIEKHIQDVEKLITSEHNYIVDDFPTGLDWFNTTQPLSKNILQGKIVVLDFFTYCCINCLHIIPHLRQLEKNFSVTSGLVVIGVHSAKFENEKDSRNILQALKKYNISHPVVNDNNCFMWNKLSISCWPTIIILGPQWQPIFSLVGEDSKDELLLFVKVALKFYKNSISSHDIPLFSCDHIVASSFLSFPGKIARWGKLFAVSDSGNHRIVIIDEDGLVKYKVGGRSSGFEDGSFETAKFNSPQGVAFYDANKIYVADTENHAIRLINIMNLSVKTVVGTGQQGVDYIGGKAGTEQEISSPWDVCIVPCSDFEPKPQFPLVGFHMGTPLNNFTSSSGPPPPPPLISSSGIPPPPPPISSSGTPPPPPPISSSGIPPPPANATFSPPPSSTESQCSSSKVLLIAAAGTHQIWAFFIDKEIWWTGKKYEKNTCVAIAGSGKEENRNNRYPMKASFAQPSGLSYSKELRAVFISDSESSSIRKLCLKDESVRHVVGGTRSPNDLFSFGDVDGKAYDVRLQHPLGVTYSARQNSLYVCDTYNHKIKVVDVSAAVCKSLHQKGDLFREPSDCCLNDSEDSLYICDTNNNCIKVYNLIDNSVKKLDLKELSEAAHTSVKDIWEEETTLSKNGGTLNLKVIFFPKEFHGKWKLDINQSKVRTASLNGKTTGNVIEFAFEFAPSESDDALQIFFDLIFCGDQTCTFKKLTLKLLVRKEEGGKQAVMCELVKNLT